MDGYMTDVQWDGATLRVHGKNKAARVALAGEDHGSDVVVTRDQIADVGYRKAGAMVNGRVDVRTVDGKRYQLHFRKKQAAGFEQLARDLGAI